MGDDPLTKACRLLAESQQIIGEKDKEIARLTAEVESHRYISGEVADILRGCDREAALRGHSDTSFARLWFSAIWRSARLDSLGTLRGSTCPNDSSILSRADRVLNSPALHEARQQCAELHEQIARITAEVERHRMTDEERAVLLGVAFTSCRSLPQWAVIEDYLARTATREEE